MKRIAVLTAAAVAGVASFQPTQADARDGRNTRAFVAGALGGLVAGALINSARTHAGPAYAYAPARIYSAAPAHQTRYVVRRAAPAYAYYAPRPYYGTSVVSTFGYGQPRFGFGVSAYRGW